jgi:hypothetical protein
MSFSPIEDSVDLGRPRSFFEFTYGDGRGDVIRYVSSTEVLITGNLAPVIAMGRSWEAWSIKHGKIMSSGSLDKASLDVMTTTDSKIADLYRAAPPSRQVFLEIFANHIGDDEYKRIWSGRVLGASFKEQELSLSCEPVSTSTLRTGLRRNYQYGCPHVLYGSACGLSRIANTATGSIIELVTSQSIIWRRGNRSIVIAAAEMVGGVFTVTLPSGREVKRAITGATPIPSDVEGRQDVSLRLMAVIPELTADLPVSVTRGCGHSWDACLAFGNTVNYGGCPNIPTKNPFTGRAF